MTELSLRQKKLLASGGFLFLAFLPFFQKKKKRFDPAGFFSLVTLAVMAFDDEESGPEFKAYTQCKEKNLELLCRMNYVIDSFGRVFKKA